MGQPLAHRLAGACVRASLLAFTVVVALGLGACGDSENPPPAGRVLAFLGGAQEVPGVITPAEGSAEAVVAGDRSRVDVTLNTSGLGSATAAHIHAGTPGANGPVLLTLFNTPDGSAFNGNFSAALTASDFVARPEVGINSFDQAITALLAGRTYLNVHTQANPSGEIRGHLGPASLEAALSPLDVTVPATDTLAAGKAVLVLNDAQSQATLTLRATELQGVQAADIHVGGVGLNGPVIFPLFSAGVGDTVNVTRTLGPAELTAQAGAGVVDYADAVRALLGGGAYVNVPSAAHPGGEIRGRLRGGRALTAALSGAGEIPPVNTAAEGSATAEVSADRSMVTVRLMATGLTDVTTAHIHIGPLGTSGPPILTLLPAGAAFTSPHGVALDAADLMPAPVQGITTFEDALNAIINGQTYVNIHTAANPAGEIRGQLEL